MKMKNILMMIMFCLMGQSVVAANIIVKNRSGKTLVVKLVSNQLISPIEIPNGANYPFSTGVHSLSSIIWASQARTGSRRVWEGYMVNTSNLNRLKLNAEIEIAPGGWYKDNFEGVTNTIMSGSKKAIKQEDSTLQSRFNQFRK